MLENFRFLSKTPSHKKFSFTPRYYNEEKDDLEKRVKAAEGFRENEESERRIRFSRTLEDTTLSRHSFQRIHHQKNMSRVRFLIILNILIIFALYIFVKLL